MASSRHRRRGPAQFFVPEFNLTAFIWRFGRSVTLGPDVITPACLTPGKAIFRMVDGLDGLDATLGSQLARFPANTDVQDSKNGIGPDTIELPAGTGRYYESR